MKRHFWKLFLVPLGVVVSPLLPLWLWFVLAVIGIGALGKRLLIL